MKLLQKLILPIMILIVFGVIYLTYFAPTESLGSFDDFDTNSNINLDVKVAVVKEKGFNRDPSSGSTIFYARDNNGKEVVVNAPADVPESIINDETIILHGHLHSDHFHATEVKQD